MSTLARANDSAQRFDRGGRERAGEKGKINQCLSKRRHGLSKKPINKTRGLAQCVVGFIAEEFPRFELSEKPDAIRRVVGVLVDFFALSPGAFCRARSNL